MKCPLLFIGEFSRIDIKQSDGFDCLHAGCAWFDKDIEECCIPLLSTGLKVINKNLEELIGKMPHKEQFRK